MNHKVSDSAHRTNEKSGLPTWRDILILGIVVIVQNPRRDKEAVKEGMQKCQEDLKNSLEKKIDSVEEKINSVEEKIAVVEEKIERIQEQVDERIEALNGNFSLISQRVDLEKKLLAGGNKSETRLCLLLQCQ
ncbi:hypothetical protein TNCV_3049991 [Trichonephila clavipes]|nr:hypothetical protein TNCV_3049991 [Trichonephila clavipes]